MPLPSLSPIELQLLLSVIAVLIFFGSFLALLFSAVFGLGLARLLYVSGCWCVRKIHQSYSGGTRTIHAVAPTVPHHSH